jgi:hypothetical protein
MAADGDDQALRQRSGCGQRKECQPVFCGRRSDTERQQRSRTGSCDREGEEGAGAATELVGPRSIGTLSPSPNPPQSGCFVTGRVDLRAPRRTVVSLCISREGKSLRLLVRRVASGGVRPSAAWARRGPSTTPTGARRSTTLQAGRRSTRLQVSRRSTTQPSRHRARRARAGGRRRPRPRTACAREDRPGRGRACSSCAAFRVGGKLRSELRLTNRPGERRRDPREG